MEKKVTLELTEEQADALDLYLLMTTNYGKGEREAWESLAKERNEDGTLKFPNAPSNANFWKEQNETIENILKILQGAKIGG
nr:MAG TPA: hypothetical protein [Caudoviricetes sp.]